MYLYENHLGGIYTSDEIIDEEELYCEECGDSDWYIGSIEEDDPIEAAYKLINDHCEISLCEEDCDDEKCDECPLFDYSGGYKKEYIVGLFKNWFSEEKIEEFFNNLIKEKLSEKEKGLNRENDRISFWAEYE